MCLIIILFAIVRGEPVHKPITLPYGLGIYVTYVYKYMRCILSDDSARPEYRFYCCPNTGRARKRNLYTTREASIIVI